MDVVVARIGKAHALRGEVTVELRTDDPHTRLAVGSTLTTTAPKGWGVPRELAVRSTRVHNGIWLVAFDGIPDRTGAEGLRGTLLHAPDVYMDKLAVGPGYDKDVVSLDMSPAERVHALAKAGGVKPEDITVCILERPRHEDMIAEVRATGAAIRLITDGDVAGVMHVAEPDKTGIDMYMGSGGAPEGVLAASALKCMGGQIWGRLLFRNDDERGRGRVRASRHGTCSATCKS